MKKILISACLLGVNCRYCGEKVTYSGMDQLMRVADVIPVCPEQIGGLATPRPPSERFEGRVLAKDGTDVTRQYVEGARETLRLAQLLHIDTAVLKERSPSCGSGIIYDGTFTGTRIPGDGVTAELLKANGIRVIGETHVDELIRELKGE